MHKADILQYLFVATDTYLESSFLQRLRNVKIRKKNIFIRILTEPEPVHVWHRLGQSHDDETQG